MALSPRQELSYNHLAQVYRPTRTYAGDNKPSAESYELVEGGPFRCRFEIKQSVDLATAIGRVEGDIAETQDLLHWSEDQEIDDNYWVQNVSLRPDGTQANMYGRWWVVRGQPSYFVQSERREGGKIVTRASQEKNPPLGIED